MNYQRQWQLRHRRTNAYVGLGAFGAYMGYVGFVVGQYPPSTWWEWAVLIVGVAFLGFFFGSGAVANARARGICEATWYPESKAVQFELKMTEDFLRRKRAKWEAKLQ